MGVARGVCVCGLTPVLYVFMIDDGLFVLTSC